MINLAYTIKKRYLETLVVSSEELVKAAYWEELDKIQCVCVCMGYIQSTSSLL